MTPFGFTPGNSDDSNEPVDFAAMMQQMQQQQPQAEPLMTRVQQTLTTLTLLILGHSILELQTRSSIS